MLTQGSNILAVKPNVVVLASGNPEIENKLRTAGIEVHLFAGENVATNNALDCGACVLCKHEFIVIFCNLIIF